MAMPADSIVFTATLGELAEVPGTPFAYWAPRSLRELFQKFPPLDRDVARQRDKPKIADVKQGLATADDLRFTRFFWEVPVGQIATSREETLQGKKWVPFARGTWLDRFFYDYQVVVNWGNDGEEIKGWINPKTGRPYSNVRMLRQTERRFFFREGLAWMTSPQAGSIMKGTLNRLNMRYLPSGCIFSVAMSSVFPLAADVWSLLSILNSELIWAIVRLKGEAKFQVGYIAPLPIVRSYLPGLTSLAREAHDLLREWSTGDETSTVFIEPWLLQVWDAVKGRWGEDVAVPRTGHPLSRDFRWSEAGRGLHIPWRLSLGLEVPPDFEGGGIIALANACVKWERRLRGRIEEIQRQIDEDVYRIYEISEEDRALIEAELAAPEGETEEGEPEAQEGREVPEGVMPPEEHIRRLIHFLAHQALKEDPDGIVTAHDVWFADGRKEPGLAARVRGKMEAIFGELAAAAIERELRQALGEPLDDWLATEFFGYHLGLYRLRPIVWQISSRPRGRAAFSCFIYWHKLDADTLRKVRAVYLRPLMEAATREAERRKRQLLTLREAGEPMRQQREAERRWRDAQGRLEELKALDEHLEQLLQPHSLEVQSRSQWVKAGVNEIVRNGYRPNRDYGVRVNIEPLKQAGVLAADARRVKG
jgi:hypothetical protein